MEEGNAGMGKGGRGGKRKGIGKLRLRSREGETGWRRVRRSEEMGCGLQCGRMGEGEMRGKKRKDGRTWEDVKRQ